VPILQKPPNLYCIHLLQKAEYTDIAQKYTNDNHNN
jgi:hypothetical protein